MFLLSLAAALPAFVAHLHYVPPIPLRSLAEAALVLAPLGLHVPGCQALLAL
jgi:hypothetical protein